MKEVGWGDVSWTTLIDKLIAKKTVLDIVLHLELVANLLGKCLHGQLISGESNMEKEYVEREAVVQALNSEGITKNMRAHRKWISMVLCGYVS